MVKSFYFKQVKKGQAAIEFLMTYGWMLLVVLIVGALIFSFVDFGQLLPNTVDMSNNFRGEPTQSDGQSSTDTILVTFVYNGNDRVTINSSDVDRTSLEDQLGNECPIRWLKNVDTNTHGPDTATTSNFEIAQGGEDSEAVVFLRGHIGIAEFDCSTGSGGPGLFPNDVFEGTIRVTAINARTSVPIRSEGNIRVGISS